MKVSKDKKYKTRQGNKVAIYEIYEEQAAYCDCVHGAYKNDEGKWIPARWDIVGRYGLCYKSHLDLIEVDEEVKKNLEL